MIFKNKLFEVKKLIMLVLIFMLINSLCFTKNVYGVEVREKVLVLYDSYKEYGEKRNILNDLNRICLEVTDDIEIMRFSAYEGADLSQYKAIFILNLSKDTLSESLKQNLIKYNNKIFWVGKESYNDFLNTDKVIYIEELYFDNYNYKKIYEVLYKNFNKEYEKNTYLYFDKVTPFNDLNVLIEEIDYLKKNGIPFFIEVPPVFKNENLSAMNRFAEVLRYAQANGGEIVLTLPQLVSLDVQGKNIEEKFDLGFKNYINYWIYPTAISISDYWLYRDDLKELLKKTDTIFIDSNVDIGILEFDKYNLSSYKNVIEKVNLENGNNLYNNVAVNISSKLSINEFKNKIKELLEKDIYFKDTHDISSSITIDNLNINSNKKGIFLNDKNVVQVQFIDSEKYKTVVDGYENQRRDDVNISLDKTNKILVIISTVVVILFIIIALISFNIDKRKFLK
ncbi:hypothetical protein ST12_09070 [Clostridium botulinum]|uniref:DUF2334 domain-containing protein n=1 Tax=Clostridium botulinum TaxID=1491 RepID=UPI000174E903|nr:DUF2334 domain-containing protein [Clostridium botulinum]ACD51688.1 hypothetical protein CLH_1883 [Clostridium botulinum E3 str. Alaska E43]AJF29833.1 hypothetical protein ST13_09070 [Clostridium botulinum]AJF32894.1 hypothetical protein ST12_09070 [Clostridium botulinum]MBY6788994.1 DUF2334 domain-containing protein [Clostridium botulinum]MBY6811121.1 DUF2334 domain-containing protein [Clostridium botulinum]